MLQELSDYWIMRLDWRQYILGEKWFTLNVQWLKHCRWEFYATIIYSFEKYVNNKTSKYKENEEINKTACTTTNTFFIISIKGLIKSIRVEYINCIIIFPTSILKICTQNMSSNAYIALWSCWNMRK